jgi:hypothetical protein
VTFVSQKRLRNLEKFEEVCVSQEEDIFCSVMYLTKIILVLYTTRQESFKRFDKGTNLVVDMTEIKKEEQGLLDHGVIGPNSSPFGSLIMMLPKNDGTWGMFVDFQALNKITVRNQYRLPRIYDLLDQLKNVVYFTKLYLHSGYHQIRVAEHDAWKTTFKTN